MKRAAWSLLLLISFAALGAPWLSPNPPNRRFDDLLYAPPTRVHVLQDGVRAPFIHPWRVVSRLERRFEQDRHEPSTAAMVYRQALSSPATPTLVRRCCCSAPTATVATSSRACSTARAPRSPSRSCRRSWRPCSAHAWAESPAMQAAGSTACCRASRSSCSCCRRSTWRWSLRAVLPLVLPPATVFVLLIAIFTLLGWPIVARGVRAIVLVGARARLRRGGARSRRAATRRVLLRHLLPAARGFLKTQASLLVPAFMLAEATLVVRRPRISRTPCRRGERCCRTRRTWRCSAMRPGRWRRRSGSSRSFSASTCLRRAKGGRRYNWSHEALHRHLHADRHAVPIRRHASTKPACAATCGDGWGRRSTGLVVLGSNGEARATRRRRSRSRRRSRAASTCRATGRSSPAPAANPRARRLPRRGARLPPAWTRCSCARRPSSSRR